MNPATKLTGTVDATLVRVVVDLMTRGATEQLTLEYARDCLHLKFRQQDAESLCQQVWKLIETHGAERLKRSNERLHGVLGFFDGTHRTRTNGASSCGVLATGEKKMVRVPGQDDRVNGYGFKLWV
jgi:hypothetical protein